MHLCLKIKEKDFYTFKGQHLGLCGAMEMQRRSEKVREGKRGLVFEKVQVFLPCCLMPRKGQPFFDGIAVSVGARVQHQPCSPVPVWGQLWDARAIQLLEWRF